MKSVIAATPAAGRLVSHRARRLVVLGAREAHVTDIPRWIATLLAITLSCGWASAADQGDLSRLGPPRTHAAGVYTVGDLVSPSLKFDDDGFPNRPYAILIVDGANVVVVDRVTRRVVEVH
ncbi:MAG: hypothetical protein JO288_09490 [Hyphomicrobiales bacterium]|nr:hypothetical protein [Hyphomicrobiales bacterium]